MNKKVVIAVLVLAFILGCVMGKADSKEQTLTYEVQNGDTLWNISGKYVAEDQDIREFYMKVIEDNQLNRNGDIQTGQILMIRHKE